MEISELQLASRITCHCQELCDSQAIAPFLSLPRLAADTAGPEMLFLAFAGTVSVTTCMSLAGVCGATAVQ